MDARRPSHAFTIRHRDVWAIALPATLAFVTEPLAGIVDLTVVGRLGDAGLLAGLVLGALAFDVIIAMFFFLRLGTGGLVAQSVGAKDADDGLIHIARALGIAAIAGLSMAAAYWPLVHLSSLLLRPAPDAVASFETYLSLRLWSAPFVLANFAFLGWFYGRAAATTGMMVQMFMHGANIVLSIGFVYGLRWGVFGVGLGTLAAQALTAIVGMVILVRHYRGVANVVQKLSLSSLLDFGALKKLFALSRDLMIRSLALQLAFAFFIAQISHLGSVALAGAAILLNFQMVTAFFLDGQAQAAEQLAGKAVGANYPPAFAQSIRLTLGWGYAISGIVFLFWMVAGPFLIDAMTTVPEVQAEARTYLFLSALGALTGVMPFVMDGVMTGATLNTIIRNGMVASLLIFLGAAYMLQAAWGLTGLWLALHIFYMARGFIFLGAVRYRTRGLFSVPA